MIRVPISSLNWTSSKRSPMASNRSSTESCSSPWTSATMPDGNVSEQRSDVRDVGRVLCGPSTLFVELSPSSDSSEASTSMGTNDDMVAPARSASSFPSAFRMSISSAMKLDARTLMVANIPALDVPSCLEAKQAVVSSPPQGAMRCGDRVRVPGVQIEQGH